MVRNSVNDFVVDAGASGGRERRPAVVLVGVILKKRLGTAQPKVLGNDGVDIGRRHSRRNNMAHKLVRLPNADARLPH